VKRLKETVNNLAIFPMCIHSGRSE